MTNHQLFESSKDDCRFGVGRICKKSKNLAENFQNWSDFLVNFYGALYDGVIAEGLLCKQS